MAAEVRMLGVDPLSASRIRCVTADRARSAGVAGAAGATAQAVRAGQLGEQGVALGGGSRSERAGIGRGVGGVDPRPRARTSQALVRLAARPRRPAGR